MNKKVLILTFLSVHGKEIKITINSPVEDISTNKVSEVMDQVIALGAVCSNLNEIITRKKTAQVIQKQEESIRIY